MNTTSIYEAGVFVSLNDLTPEVADEISAFLASLGITNIPGTSLIEIVQQMRQYAAFRSGFAISLTNPAKEFGLDYANQLEERREKEETTHPNCQAAKSRIQALLSPTQSVQRNRIRLIYDCFRAIEIEAGDAKHNVTLKVRRFDSSGEEISRDAISVLEALAASAPHAQCQPYIWRSADPRMQRHAASPANAINWYAEQGLACAAA